MKNVKHLTATLGIAQKFDMDAGRQGAWKGKCRA